MSPKEKAICLNPCYNGIKMKARMVKEFGLRASMS